MSVVVLASVVASASGSASAQTPGNDQCKNRDRFGDCIDDATKPKSSRQAIAVRTWTPGVSIAIDGAKAGETDADGTFTVAQHLSPGQHALRATLADHFDYSATFTAPATGAKTIDVELIPYPRLIADIRNPAGGLQESVLGIGPNLNVEPRRTFQLPQKTPIVIRPEYCGAPAIPKAFDCALQVSAPGFVDVREMKTIEPRKENKLLPVLQPFTGVLKVETDLTGLVIVASAPGTKTAIAVTDDGGHVTFEHMTAGTYTVHFDAAPFRPQSSAPITTGTVDLAKLVELVKLEVIVRASETRDLRRDFIPTVPDPEFPGRAEAVLRAGCTPPTGSQTEVQRFLNLKSESDSGNPRDCLEYGWVLRAARKDTEAYDKFEVACRKGSAEACVNAGWMLSTGLGVKAPDPAGARQRFVSACSTGYLPACYRLHLPERKQVRWDPAPANAREAAPAPPGPIDTPGSIEPRSKVARLDSLLGGNPLDGDHKPGLLLLGLSLFFPEGDNEKAGAEPVQLFMRLLAAGAVTARVIQPSGERVQRVVPAFWPLFSALGLRINVTDSAYIVVEASVLLLFNEFSRSVLLSPNARVGFGLRLGRWSAVDIGVSAQTIPDQITSVDGQELFQHWRTVLVPGLGVQLPWGFGD